MRRPEYFYEKTAEQLGLDLDLVTKVNKFFWQKQIKGATKRGKDYAVYIKYIGTLYIWKRKVNEDIIETISKIRGMKKSLKFEKSKQEQIIERYKTKLKGLLVLRNTCANGMLNLKTRKKEKREQIA